MIRKALLQDGPGKHEAHMLSIRELCSQDHDNDEIAGWGHRRFDSEAWSRLLADKNCRTWILELDSKIEGYATMELRLHEGNSTAYFHGLYLTPTAAGRGWGRKMAELMIEVSRQMQAEAIQLHSTITARDFYLKFGFEETGPQVTIPIGGAAIRCHPMRYNF